MRQISIAMVLACAAVPAAAQLVGPSTSQTPYLIPTAPGVVTKSIISNGGGSVTKNGVTLADETYGLIDAAGNVVPGGVYRLSGIPDGLGAYDNGDGTFTLLVNHELGANQGRTSALGTPGAFVSQWKINKIDLSVVGGRDLITKYQPNPADNSTLGTGNTAFGRFCSADLPEQSALQFGSFGSGERMFFNGEETGSEGRGVATVVSTGVAYNLPHTGKFSWENNVPNPKAQMKTIVAGLDDSGDGQVYFYEGMKKATGTGVNAVDDAGLIGGNLFGLRIPLLNNNSNGGTTNRESTAATAASFSGSRFEMHNFGDVSNITGAELELRSDTNQVTQFARAEDGAWNPLNPNEFFFVTTTSSRLFRATFDDLANISLGGKIDVLVDFGVGAEADDNITVVNDNLGRTYVLIQEDGGSQPTAGDDIWVYDVANNTNLRVGTHDPAYSFFAGAESTGIIPAPFLGEGVFLSATQAAANFNSTFPDTHGLVAGGQIYTVTVPQVVPEPTALALVALGAAGVMRRRSR
jgi:hypothetical protein